MNIEYLYYYVEAAKRGSISKAACSYNISQQGLSRAIKQLEREYGVTLLNRNDNSIELTKAGEIFLEEAEALISSHNHLKERISHYAAKKSLWETKTTVLITLNVAFNVWPVLGKDLAKAFPKNLFAVNELLHDQIVTSLCLSPDDSTFAIMSIPDLLSEEFSTLPLEFEPLAHVRLMAKVGKTSQYAQRETITTGDLRSAPLIVHDDPALDRMLSHLGEGNDDILESIILRTNCSEIMEESLRQFDAIGFSNTFCDIYNQSPDFIMLPLEKTIETPLYFVYNKMIACSEKMDVIRTYMKSTIEEKYPLVSFYK